MRRTPPFILILAASLALACQTQGADVQPDDPPPSIQDASRGSDATDEPDASGETDADPEAPLPDTRADLDAFWSAHGGKGAFSTLHVDAVEAMLLAEDDVLAGRYDAARARVDAIFAAYPKSDPVWWSTPVPTGVNLGTPVAYYGLRMLEEVARVGAADDVAPLGTLQMTVVRVACATGRRPASADLTQGEDVSLTLHPGLDDRAFIDPSLRLFRAYVRALTGGRLDLDVEVIDVDECTTVTFDPNSRVSSIQNATTPLQFVPEDTRSATDMWWIIYPSNVPPGPEFAGAEFITGGMGSVGDAPLFIIDDLWLVRKPPHLGDGPYSEVERRVYLPQWLQHEYFHHLYRLYPEFGLEARGHQWFDRTTWPDDFVGEWEPDYYAESFTKRLAGASTPLHDRMRVSSLHRDLSGVTADDLTGRYTREPVENGYHDVTVSLVNGQLVWSNAANVSWGLTWEDGTLSTGDDCPYGAQDLTVRVPFADAAGGQSIEGLVFLGELYRRRER